MPCRLNWIGWLSLAAGAFWVSAGGAAEQDSAAQKRAAARVPLSQVKDDLRDRVKQVLDGPTLYTRGPAEAFTGQADFYDWLLDHPDRGSSKRARSAMSSARPAAACATSRSPSSAVASAA